MKKNLLFLASLVAAAVVTAGCLVEDTTATIYLEPNGAATWIVLEKNVRSDSQKPDDRAREEKEFFTAVTAERHPIALGFRGLDPTFVRTTILRGEQPYTVLTEARFERFDAMMERFARAFGGSMTSAVERRGGTTIWTLSVLDLADEPQRSDADRAVDALAGDDLRFVLVTGRFVAAAGFELSGDRRTATLRLPDDGPADPDQPLRLSLTWVEER